MCAYAEAVLGSEHDDPLCVLADGTTKPLLPLWRRPVTRRVLKIIITTIMIFQLVLTDVPEGAIFALIHWSQIVALFALVVFLCT
jgi:hypothetical protein